jgi:hypothetical protein
MIIDPRKKRVQNIRMVVFPFVGVCSAGKVRKDVYN